MSDEKNISEKVLAALTGMDESRCREIAKLGFFPKPQKDGYPTTRTLQGLFKYFLSNETGKKDSPFPEIISQGDLAKLANLTTRRLNQLASAGKIPNVVSRGVYPWGAVNSLFAYYQRDGEDIQREKLLKLTAERKMKEDELAKGRGLLIEIAAVRQQIGQAVGFMFEERQRWNRELPPSLAGLPAVEVDKIMDAQNRAGWKILEEKFNKICK